MCAIVTRMGDASSQSEASSAATRTHNSVVERTNPRGFASSARAVRVAPRFLPPPPSRLRPPPRDRGGARETSGRRSAFLRAFCTPPSPPVKPVTAQPRAWLRPRLRLRQPAGGILLCAFFSRDPRKRAGGVLHESFNGRVLLGGEGGVGGVVRLGFFRTHLGRKHEAWSSDGQADEKTQGSHFFDSEPVQRWKRRC